jgi:hypothetical protein
MSGSRYVRGPRGLDAGDDWWPVESRTVSVIVEDETLPVDTGLVDQFGVSIYRVRERHKIGF